MTVAAGKLANQSREDIAKAAGCTLRHVRRLEDEPETQLLARDMLKPHERKLKKLVDKALVSISRSLDAKLKTVYDHRAQMIAAGRLREYLELLRVDARELADADAEGLPQFTWEEFMLIYRRKSVSGGVQE